MKSAAIVHRTDLPASRSLWTRLRFGRRLYQFCAAPDTRPEVVQFLSLSRFAIPWLSRLRRRGVSTVLTATMVPEVPRPWLKKELFRYWMTASLRHVECVVASSRLMKECFEDLGVTTRIEIIPNGVDLSRFRSARTPDERDRLRAGLGVGPADPLILFVGGISPRKRVDLLLEMWGIVGPSARGAHLVLVGPRRDLERPELDGFRRRLEALRTASGASDRVHFVGAVENIEEYYRAADIFVFASRREGMGNVVLEAMATGLPVVLTPYLGLPSELGAPGREYVMVEPEAARLAIAVERLLGDPSLRRELGRRARAWAEEHLDVEDSLDRYAELYREMATHGREVAST